MESQAVCQAKTQAKKKFFRIASQTIEPVDPVSDGVLADRLERGDGVAVLEEAEAAAADVIICNEKIGCKMLMGFTRYIGCKVIAYQRKM